MLRKKKVKAVPEVRKSTVEILPLNQYDRIIVSFSGGKDSLACVLRMLELGVPREQMEVWHQAVDGMPGQSRRFFDWPITENYCRAVAWALGIPIRFQWREGGFWGELHKQEDRLKPAAFELQPGGLLQGNIGYAGGERGKIATRLKFPNPSRTLQVAPGKPPRWCTPILKIDVSRAALRNLPEFKAGTFLMVTGERREESDGRATYAEAEQYVDPTAERTVHQWRAVIDFQEQDVWDIIERWRIRPHPAYYLGFSRVSCMPCVFGGGDQWASIRQLDPARFNEILGLERQFGTTIKEGGDIELQADRSKKGSFLVDDPTTQRLSLSEEYPYEAVIVPEGEEWQLPQGAFKEGQGGPT